MEKQLAAKSKNKILSFLPKTAQLAAARVKQPDITSHKLRTHNSRKGFSGPILSMIPAEARLKPTKFETTPEPTSPKVSCMGQIKHKNRIISKKKHGPAPELKKKPSGVKKIFGAGRKADNKASVDYGNKPPIPDRAPSLSQMRRFASGRESTLTNFDWATARIAPEDQDRGFCSEGYSDGEDDVIIPFSAPILVAGAIAGGRLRLEPRKEINLWKRRTMAQPEPLQLSMVRAQ
ncbi:uncharacterized protein at1g76070 [Phtheirospermum japonicum]|uniref:Uncharacterized protein at1g76070 n=1 Tax=Phtheirospermum japonicum TaxID=374723 RepID=A0A830CJ09_9LAMI|nr:uncharacterized protein at1g76070 [Phtheirospermum japonicum]